jgi:predicted nuclease with TOPRIM domain
MPLKFKYGNKLEIPAEHQALYVERDGAWMLDAEGAAEKSKLDEFRTTNIALMKERDDLRKRFEGIDPDEVRKLAEEKQKLEEEKQLKSGELEKVLENRVKGLKSDGTSSLRR